MPTAQVAYQSAFTRLDRRRHHRSSCRNGGSCWPASMSATSIGVRRIGAISRCILASATPSVATTTQQRPVPSASCSSSREATLRQVMSRASLASGCLTRRARAVGRGRGRLERMLRSAEPTPPYRRSEGSNGAPGRRPLGFVGTPARSVLSRIAAVGRPRPGGRLAREGSDGAAVRWWGRPT